MGTIAPSVMAGVLLFLFRSWNMDVAETTIWVQENRNLWDSMQPEYHDQIQKMAKKIGAIDWLDADWAIDAVKGEFPGVASLFMGWPEGKLWLTEQIENIKTQAKQ